MQTMADWFDQMPELLRLPLGNLPGQRSSPVSAEGLDEVESTIFDDESVERERRMSALPTEITRRRHSPLRQR